MHHLYFFILCISCAFLLRFSESLDFWYAYCQNTTTCGNLSIEYPLGLWSYGCGNPNFQLTCLDNNPQLIIGDDNYTVLSVSYPDHTISIVSDKFLHYCDPSDYSNFSLASSDFTVADEFSANITILQFPPNAPPDLISQLTRLNCENSSWYFSINPPSGASYYTSEKVQVPVKLGVNYTAANPNFLQQGFQVEWHDDVAREENCTICASSGGICGYLVPGSDFTCYCKEGPRANKCQKGNNHLSAIIGGSVGGATLIAAAAVFAFMCLKTMYERRQTHHSSNTTLLASDLSNGASKNNKAAAIKATALGTLQIFSYEALKVATNDFSDSNQLGDGGFGSVYLAKLDDGRTAAVKRLYEGNSKRVDQFINEVQILSSFNHPNLVRLYGCTSPDSPDLLLVYEFAPNGTLAQHLHGEKKKQGLPWDTRLKICTETAQALAFLHSLKPPIYHRDVKTTNILLDEQFRVKVADFGLSRFVPLHATHVSTAPQGTPGYLDPDYHQCFQLTQKSDVYSFGVVLVEIISAKLAVDVNRDRKEISLANMAIAKIKEGILHELVDPSLEFDCNKEIKAMVTAVAELAFRCLAAEKDDRPDMTEIVAELEQIKQHGGRGCPSHHPPPVHSINSGDKIKMHNGTGPLSPTSVQETWPSTTTSPETVIVQLM